MNEAFDEAKRKEAENNGTFGKYYPTIFVSCGGTGAKVFQRVRRLSLERFGGVSREDLPGVAYVSIDTDVSSAQANNQGQDFGAVAPLIDFRAEERLNLDGSTVKNFVASEATLASNPHIAEWFEPKLMVSAKGMDISKGAGQVRPIARLVAFENRDRIVQLFDRAYREVTALRSDDSRCIAGGKVRVVICGSLAGGTGAGTFLDVAAMIRNTQENVDITGVFALPDVFLAVEKAENRKKIQANGYACLSELAYFTNEVFTACYDGRTPVTVTPNKPLFDKVYLFEASNETGLSATNPNIIYDVAGTALFMDFFQGEFAFGRDSVAINRAQLLLQTHREQAGVKSREGSLVQIDMEAYRQRFMSMGLCRLSTSAWRLLNGMSYWLASELIDILDNPTELLKAEQPLKMSFAQKLGIYQGTFTTDDNRTVPQRQVEDALLANPDTSGGTTILDAVSLHFEDLTDPVAQKEWWEGRNCGSELKKRFNAMATQWAGAFDDGHRGALAEKIFTNRQALLRSSSGLLQKTIEDFCEMPDVGPHRVALVMNRLVTDMRNSDMYWVKEMEKRAEESATEAERWKADFDSWVKLASDADTAWGPLRRFGTWQEQMAKCQDAAVNHWRAVANRLKYAQAASLMRELAAYIYENGVQKQEQLASSLREMRAVFTKFQKDYAKDVESEIFNYLTVDDGEGGLEKIKQHFLGETEDKRRASLGFLYRRVLGHMGIQKNADLRDRMLTQKDRFVADFRRCCWLALRGSHGSTDWFGESKQALVERGSIYDMMRERFGSAANPQLKALADKVLKNAMPWVRTHSSASRVRGVIRDCYVVVPRASTENQEVRKAFLQAIQDAAAAVPSLNVFAIAGSESSEITVYVEAFALIPAHFSSLHGQTGLFASYRDISARRRQGDVMGFLHIDRDVVRFPRLLPMEAGEAPGRIKAWRLFLLGVITGVVKTRENAVRVEPMHKKLFPVFHFEVEAQGGAISRELGQARSAIDDLEHGQDVRGPLDGMIRRHYVSQPQQRYERLLALVRYYKYCIFPARRVKADEGNAAAQSYPVAWAALDEIEAELVSSWLEVVRPPDAEQATKALLNSTVPQLLWRLREFAEHTGIQDKDAALVEGLEDSDYLEQPQKLPDDDAQDEQRRERLRMRAFELLPAELRQNPALRHQSRYYPWLRLSPRRRFHLPSQHAWAQARDNDHTIESQLADMSAREMILHFQEFPEDTHARLGAKVWVVEYEGAQGVLRPWVTYEPLKRMCEANRVNVYTGSIPPNGAPEVAQPPIGGGFSAPPSSAPLQYSGPTCPQGAPKSASEIAALITAAPASPHYVVVSGAWAAAETHPEVAAALSASSPPPPPGLAPPPPPGFAPAPPPMPAVKLYYASSFSPNPTEKPLQEIVDLVRAQPTGGHQVHVNGAWIPAQQDPRIAAALAAVPAAPAAPPAPPAFAPVVPPPPVALPAIPDGPFHYSTGGAWEEISGAELVGRALALPAGNEGYVVVGGAAAPVSSHPQLAAAIAARR